MSKKGTHNDRMARMALIRTGYQKMALSDRMTKHGIHSERMARNDTYKDRMAKNDTPKAKVAPAKMRWHSQGGCRTRLSYARPYSL